MPSELSVVRHDRDIVGMTYVYPVVSRRAGGVSLGVNLNPNNACNWRCVYCQVPNLARGSAPELDLTLLESELATMLDEIVHGDFMEARVPEGYRRLNDVALSGNGEPTTSRQLGDVVELIGKRLAAVGPAGAVKIILITNGSMMNKAFVKEALRTLAGLNGEVWFKLDVGTSEGMRSTNGVSGTLALHLDRLSVAAGLCPTWLQTCVFSRQGADPSETELQAYLDCLRQVRRRGMPVRGVLLYTVARASLQPEAHEVAALPLPWLESFAQRVQAAGFVAKVSA